MAQTAQIASEDWTDRHRKVWVSKRLLRSYYQREYYDYIVSQMPKGRSLEIGAGPGLFSEYHRCDVVTDITRRPHIDQVVDVHSMPFEDRSFDCVVGVDVVHHFRHPAKGLAEIARVLRPGGKLVLIEPWTGPVGIFVNKYLHTEDCFKIMDPMGPVFESGKDPMDGNAMIPKTLFVDHASLLKEQLGLEMLEASPFSCFGFLGTGGFTRWGLPYQIGRAIIAVEKTMPTAVWRFAGIKMRICARRVESA